MGAMPIATERIVRKSANIERVELSMQKAWSAVGGFIAYWGFKEIHGRVWTLLATRKEPMTQAGIARCLGVSRALVSATVDDLSHHGLVRPVDTRRNAPYVAVFDVWPTIADVLRSREWMIVESARLALEAALEEVSTAERQGTTTPYDPGRLRALLSMTEAAQGFLRILIKLRNTPTVQTFTGWAGKASGLLEQIRRAW